MDRVVNKTFARFFLVSLVGVIIDLAVAAFLVRLGMQMYAAASIGLFSASLGNYILHESWTFKDRSTQFSCARFFQYLVNCLLTLGVRLFIIFIMTFFFSQKYYIQKILILTTASLISFISNFFVSNVIFKRAD